MVRRKKKEEEELKNQDGEAISGTEEVPNESPKEEKPKQDDLPEGCVKQW